MTPALALMVWAAAQTGDGDCLPALRLVPGQELLYRGSFAEESHGDGALARHIYDFESRVFVLGANELAVLTVLRDPGAPATAAPGSVRLETVGVDSQGRVTFRPGAAPPFDGPPTLEVAAVADVPPERVGPGSSWDVPDGDRPPRAWRAAGLETVNRKRCLKLVGVQQTADWERPGGDHSAWRRSDTLWLSEVTAVVQRAERIVEIRAPRQAEPGQRLVTKYELDKERTYPPQLDADLRREIQRAGLFRQQLESLAARPDLRPADFELLRTRIDQHLQAQPATPYRDAILWVRRRTEPGDERESAPVARPAEVAPSIATVGQLAPDFVTTDLLTRDATRMGHWRGQPVILLFYRPNGATAAGSLKALESLQQQFEGQARVAALCVTNEPGLALKQRAELGLTVPVFAGHEVQALYVPESTPRWIVLDAAGVVRYADQGWGREVPSLVSRAVGKCLESDRK